jgi:two-component system response regulator YesN
MLKQRPADLPSSAPASPGSVARAAQPPAPGTIENQPRPQTAEPTAAVQSRINSFIFDAEAFTKHPSLRDLNDHLDKNPATALNSRQAAAHIGREESYFCRFFKRKVGVTYSQWNSYRRVKYALKLLSTFNESITDIAEHCGIPDLRTFERHCFKWTGFTPRVIRERLCAPNFAAHLAGEVNL